MHSIRMTNLLLGAGLLVSLSIACQLHHGAKTPLDFSAIADANNRARSERHQRLKPAKKIALDNVRVFDGNCIQEPSTVIIDEDFIGDDPKGARHIDGNGAVLLPGLIDAHCHPTDVTHLEALARNGVTSGFMMACFAAEMCSSLLNHAGLPDFLLASAPASAPRSAHGNITTMVDPTLLIHNKSEVPAWMDRQLASNPDYIKLIAESPGLSQATLNALTTESHRHDKHVVTHAASRDAYHQAIIAGSDHIHHAPLDKVLTQPLVEAILRQHQVSTPTLTMMRATAENQPEIRKYVAARESVRKMHQAGVAILAGTDANMQAGVPASVPFGGSMHDEIENLIEAGFSNVEALRAATVLPALHFGLKDRGVIAKGMRADMLLVDGNPLLDIKATRKIKKVWIAGVEVDGI